MLWFQPSKCNLYILNIKSINWSLETFALENEFLDFKKKRDANPLTQLCFISELRTLKQSFLYPAPYVASLWGFFHMHSQETLLLCQGAVQVFFRSPHTYTHGSHINKQHQPRWKLMAALSAELLTSLLDSRGNKSWLESRGRAGEATFRESGSNLHEGLTPQGRRRPFGPVFCRQAFTLVSLSLSVASPSKAEILRL